MRIVLMIVLFVAIAAAVSAQDSSKTVTYSCYTTDADGELGHFSDIILGKNKLDENVIVYIQNGKYERSHYTENERVIVWSFARKQENHPITFILSKKTSDVYMSWFDLKKARNSDGNPSSWMGLSCSKD